ncbi:unnamed protein product, partial [Closterium sp. NIES-54]
GLRLLTVFLQGLDSCWQILYVFGGWNSCSYGMLQFLLLAVTSEAVTMVWYQQLRFTSRA